MSTERIASAMQRVETVLRRRPDSGLHDDAPATARWESGTRVVSSHANGTRIATDIPDTLGGSGDQVTPGWMFRAGLASCLATRIAMGAAAQGIEMAALEVKALSRSDTRGLLGIADDRGEAVYAGPSDVEMRVRISAPGTSAEALRMLVESSGRCSPISVAVQNATRVQVHVEVDS